MRSKIFARMSRYSEYAAGFLARISSVLSMRASTSCAIGKSLPRMASGSVQFFSTKERQCFPPFAELHAEQDGTRFATV